MAHFVLKKKEFEEFNICILFVFAGALKDIKASNLLMNAFLSNLKKDSLFKTNVVGSELISESYSMPSSWTKY